MKPSKGTTAQTADKGKVQNTGPRDFKNSPEFQGLVRYHQATQKALDALRQREKGRTAKGVPPAPKVDAKRPFNPNKCNFPIEQLGEWLNERTTNEKLVACVFYGLILEELQGTLKDAGAYDGLIGSDLWESWKYDLSTLAKLDAEQARVLEVLAFLEHEAGV